MKTKLLSLFIMLFAFATATVPAQITNSGFENGTTVGSYEEPYPWGTSNAACSGPFYPVTKSTDHYPAAVGNYSARLENNTALGLSYCAMGVVGTGQYPHVKFPITGHPNGLTGYYKFSPLNNDTMTIRLKVFNGMSMVANAVLQSTAAAVNWTSFNITLSIYATADSASITCAAYNPSSIHSMPQGNSVLYIDNFNFDNLITSVAGQNDVNNAFSLYPNPASDMLTLNIEGEKINEQVIIIYNMMGVMVKTEIIKQNQQQINLGDLSNGVYNVALKSKDLTVNKRLIIQK
jgi:hypothetical protein